MKLLMEHKGAEIVTISAATVPPMRKSLNPYFGDVQQITRINGIINWQYESAVNRQRIREGLEPDFKSDARAWGVRIPGTPFVMHKDQIYLEIKVEGLQELWYRSIETGKVIPDGAIQEYLFTHNESARQGVEREIILRDFNIKNIMTITHRGTAYRIIGTRDQ